jgi:hypothetical protein
MRIKIAEIGAKNAGEGDTDPVAKVDRGHVPLVHAAALPRRANCAKRF